MKFIEEFKRRHEFSAENCKMAQAKISHDAFEKKVEDITARIKFVIGNSNDESTVIYHVKPYEKELYNNVSNYFAGKGFLTTTTKIAGLEDEYLIISW